MNVYHRRFSVGPPGATGPGADFTLAHEVGHIVILAPVVAANRQLSQALAALNTAVAHAPMPNAALAAWNTWIHDQQAANTAVLGYNTAVEGGQTADQLVPLLTAARASVATRNASRAALAGAGAPQVLRDRADVLDRANDALLAAADRSPIFNELATRPGFHRFTPYAATGGEQEWFPETFALFINDPDRSLQMNRPIFLWFQAGMPMDRNWKL